MGLGCILGSSFTLECAVLSLEHAGEMKHLALRCEWEKKKNEKIALNHPSVWLPKEKAS